jgi:hypothetical protein
MNLVQGQAVMDLPGKDNNCRAESLGLEEDPDKASTWASPPGQVHLGRIKSRVSAARADVEARVSYS